MKPPLARVLTPPEIAACRYFVARVLDEVRAPLAQASLFGSKARQEARLDSDLDVLLVFERLPPSREPFAGHAEFIADEVAAETGIPVSVWSVALTDLEEGSRTPMLVDAMEDALPIWSSQEPLPCVAFTPADAIRCATSLLERVAEGGVEFREALDAQDPDRASTRARDDIIRLCTCLLLLNGITRPRRADAVATVRRAGLLGSRIPRPIAATLSWAECSYGEDGKAEFATRPPPLGATGIAAVIDELRDRVMRQLSQHRHVHFRNFMNRVG